MKTRPHHTDLVDRLDMVLCRTSRLILPHALAVDDPSVVVARRARALAEPPEDEGFADYRTMTDAEVVEDLRMSGAELVGNYLASVQQEALGRWLSKVSPRLGAAGKITLEGGTYQALITQVDRVCLVLARAEDMWGDSFFNAIAVPLEPCADEALAERLELPLVGDAYPRLGASWRGLLERYRPNLPDQVRRLLRPTASGQSPRSRTPEPS